MLVSLTVGKVDAGVAVLLTEDKRLVSFHFVLNAPRRSMTRLFVFGDVVPDQTYLGAENCAIVSAHQVRQSYHEPVTNYAIR